MVMGSTMQRVYATLKSQVMTGHFTPGERLDPIRLAADLASSPTPVRDALHRLVGERLIENPPQDGFRQPRISEPAIRDLYEWLHQLALVGVAAGRMSRPPDRPDVRSPADYLEMVDHVFISLAETSSNREHRAAMANLLDRARIYHLTEGRLLEGSHTDLQIMLLSISAGSWHDVKILLNRHYRRRIRAVPAIANALR